MIALWMLYSVSIGLALALMATLMEQGVRGVGRPVRFLWLGALVLSVGLTAWAMVPVRDAVEPGMIAPVGVVEAGSPTTTLADETDAVRSWFDAVVPSVRSVVGRADSALLGVWLLMTFGAWVLLLGSALRLRRRRVHWPRASVGGQSVRLTDRIGPAVIGLLAGEIVAPRWLLALDSARQRLIIEHERQHVRARDPLLMFVALTTAALLPWNPAVWLMVRRLRRATELDCDDRVLRAIPTPEAYAALLVDMGTRFDPSSALIGAGLSASTFDLERRVSEILSRRSSLHTRAVALRFICATGILVAACAAPRPSVDLATSATGEAEGPSDTGTAVAGITAGGADTVARMRGGRGAAARRVGVGTRGGRGGAANDTSRSGGRGPALRDISAVPDTLDLRTQLLRALPLVEGRRGGGRGGIGSVAGADTVDSRAGRGTGLTARPGGRGRAPAGGGGGGGRGAGTPVITIGTPPDTLVLDREAIASLVARLHPEVLDSSDTPDTVLVALAFDDASGALTHDAAVPWRAGASTSVASVLTSMFPDLAPASWRLRVLAWSGPADRQPPGRRLITAYGVYRPR